jgi:hypothetical protein
MRKLVLTVIVIGLLAVAAHDIWRFAARQNVLSDVSLDVTRWAGESATNMSQEAIAAEIVRQAAQQDVRIARYEQTDAVVRVWAETDVWGTWVAGTVMNMAQGKSFSEAREAPLVLRTYRDARFQ